MSGHSDTNLADDARSQPTALQDVLIMAVANTAANPEAETNANPQPMSAERREFLQEALGQLQGPIESVRGVLEQISRYFTRCTTSSDEPFKQENDEEAELLLDQLEGVIEFCELIDVACDFHKIGGFFIFEVLQGSYNADFKALCGDLIATLCQNNPYCQEKMIKETNQLEVLMKLVESPSEHPTVKVKSVYALSGLLRGNEVGQDKFIEKDGYSVLLRAMQSEDNPKLRTKATFLMMGILRDSEKHKKNLTDMGYVEQLIGMLRTEHDQYHEHLMATLLELISDYSPAADEAAQTHLQLDQFIKERITFLQNKPEFTEELDYAKKIEGIVFSAAEEIPLNR